MIDPPAPDSFGSDILAALGRDASLDELEQILRAHKSIGLTQRTAMAELEALRSRVNDEARDDRILEIMDLASGWCRPDRRVWPDRDL